jgi:hypothetical protein
MVLFQEILTNKCWNWDGTFVNVFVDDKTESENIESTIKHNDCVLLTHKNEKMVVSLCYLF